MCIRHLEDRLREQEPGTQKAGRQKTSGLRSVAKWRRRLGRLARLAHRPQAAGADVEPQPDTVHRDPLALHVGAEIPVGAALRKAHIVAKGLGLATDIAFTGHGGPPLHISAANRMNPDGMQHCAERQYCQFGSRGVKAAPSRDDAYPGANLNTGRAPAQLSNFGHGRSRRDQPRQRTSSPANEYPFAHCHQVEYVDLP